MLKNRFLYFIIFFVLTVAAAKFYNKKPADSPQASAPENMITTVSNRSLSTNDSYDAGDNTKADSIVEFAVAQIGIPYVTAGKNLNGFDCSGFTWYVFKKFNVEIPPSSILQSKAGKEIEVEDLRKGDLVLFKSPTPGNNDVGHVGIVISEEGEKVLFIHSSSGRGVIIDSLNRPNYKKRYMAARRILE